MNAMRRIGVGIDMPMLITERPDGWVGIAERAGIYVRGKDREELLQRAGNAVRLWARGFPTWSPLKAYLDAHGIAYTVSSALDQSETVRFPMRISRKSSPAAG